jgi:hypothetical protein
MEKINWKYIEIIDFWKRNLRWAIAVPLNSVSNLLTEDIPYTVHIFVLDKKDNYKIIFGPEACKFSILSACGENK